MKRTVTVRQVVEGDCPLTGNFGIADLRADRRRLTRELQDAFPGADHYFVEVVYWVNEDQRTTIRHLPGFIHPDEYAGHVRLDFGAIEHARFKWKH